MEWNNNIKNYGRLEEDKDGKIICHICGKPYHSLGGHVRQVHDVTANEYKKQFGLNASQPLCSKAFSEKQRKAVLEHPEIIENLKANGTNTKMKKGCRLAKGQRRFQWQISQWNKIFSQETTKKQMANGRKLGKSKLGNKVRWKNHVKHVKTKEERLTEVEEKIAFEKAVWEVSKLCTNSDVTNEYLYANYPSNIVDEVLKREFDKLKTKYHKEKINRISKNLGLI